MFILSFLKCALLSLVASFICLFLCTWCFDQAVETKNKFIEGICWTAGTLIGISLAYLIPLICYYLH
jgi:hypothetical protein